MKAKTVFEESFKNFEFWLKRDVRKFYNFGPFLGPIYPQKHQNIAKNHSFWKNYILRAIKYHKSQVYS